MVDSHKSSDFNRLAAYLAHIPNIITMGRILLSLMILSYLFLGKYRIAFYLFILAGISDGLDGFLARRYGWFSRLGSILDPLADKILLLSSLVALAYGGHIPVWLVTLIILRDVWVISGALTYHYLIGRFDLDPPLLSKINTFFQLLLVFLVLFNLSFFALPVLLIQIMLVIVFITNMGSWISYTWVWGKRAMLVTAQRKQS